MFIFDAIAGGIIFDMVKKGLDITTKFLKNEIKTSVIESLTDEDLTIIVKQVNELSDEIKADRGKFKEAINNNNDIRNILLEIENNTQASDNKIVIDNSFFDKSPIINASQNVSINYGKE